MRGNETSITGGVQRGGGQKPLPSIPLRLLYLPAQTQGIQDKDVPRWIFSKEAIREERDPQCLFPWPWAAQTLPWKHHKVPRGDTLTGFREPDGALGLGIHV